jgi:hypothetical protein
MIDFASPEAQQKLLLATTSLTPRVREILICDTEVYKNFFLVAFKRIRDGKILTFELSDRSTIDLDRLRAIMLGAHIVTFNGMSFDIPLIFYCLDGATTEQLKRACDQIINGNVKYWDVEQVLGISIPKKLVHTDLIEPQPNAWASLKTLQGRLHGQKMQDLPYPPDAILTHEQMDKTTAYCGNDLDATENLFNALKEPLELRAAVGAEYGINFMSKSDSQIGEGIIRKRVEQITGERVEKVVTPAGTCFSYKIPPYLSFRHPDLVEMLDRLRETEFYVQHNGKVDLPPWLAAKRLTFGESTYAMGIGGLHSTESNRAIHSDDDHVLVDVDVTGYYPNIMLGSGLYPKALGPAFLDVLRKIVEDRAGHKLRAADITLDDVIRAIAKVAAEGLKIATNGIFGKLGSVYSILYAPHLMIATTLTGQLALLMLIEEAESMGISVMSANTDGLVLRIPREMFEGIEKTRFTGGAVKDLIERWEAKTGFNMEAVEYRSLYNISVNSYIAVKPDGTAKLKGPLANPWRTGDGWKPNLREQLMKNPQMTIVTNAVVDFVTKRVPIEQTIREGRDIRDFVTVVNVQGGGTWRGGYLGKVVRYLWSTDGTEILYAKPHATTGNFKKVSKSDGCRPVMDLPAEFPGDIDYDRYIEQAYEVLMDIGYDRRPEPVKPIKVFKYNAIAWFALAA